MNTKTTHILSWLLQITIAIIYLQTLYFKFTGHPASMYIFAQLGLEPYGRVGLGIMELITAILLLLPRTKLLGIVLSFGIISGAIASHLIVLGTNVQGDGGTLFYLAVIVMVATLLLIALHFNQLKSLLFTTLKFNFK